MRTSIKIALFTVLFIALAGIGAAIYLYTLKHKDLKNVKPDFIMTASELQKEFENNEPASGSKYINKVLEVSGIIQSVQTGNDKSVNISLKTDNDLSAIICTFPEVISTSGLKPGDRIKIRGECSGFLMDVLLNNCTVIGNY